MPKLISIGQLIDHSWEHYRTRFVELMSFSAWMILPALVGIISLSLYPSYTTLASQRALTASETAGVLIWVADTFLIAPVVGTWVFLSIVRLIKSQLEQKRPDIAAMGKASWPLFWPLVFVNVLVVGMVLLPFLLLVPGFALQALGFDQFGGILLIPSIILALVLSIRWFVYYTYAPFSLALENKRGRGAMTRSRRLIEGRFWSVLARTALPKLVFMFVAIVAGRILLAGADILITNTIGLNVDLSVRVYAIAYAIIAWAGIILVNPLILTTDAFLYLSLWETEKGARSK
jgi:hypothetical protein